MNNNKLLIEEINRIQSIMGLAVMKILNEAEIPPLRSSLVKGGEKIASEELTKLLEKGGVEAADKVAEAFEVILEKGSGTAEERIFISSVVRKALPEASQKMVTDIESEITVKFGKKGKETLQSIKNALLGTKATTQQLVKMLKDTLGLNISIEQLQVWRDIVREKPVTTKIKIPKTIEPKPIETKPVEPEPIEPTSTEPIEPTPELKPGEKVGKQLSVVADELSVVDDYLWRRVNKSNWFRRLLNLKRVNRSNWPAFREQLLVMVNDVVEKNVSETTDKLKLQDLEEFFKNLDKGNKKYSNKIINESVEKFDEILSQQAKQLGFWGRTYNRFKPNTLVSLRRAMKGEIPWSNFKDDWVDSITFTFKLMFLATIGEVLNGDINSVDDIKNELDLRYLTLPIPGINVWTWGTTAAWRWGKFVGKFAIDKATPLWDKTKKLTSGERIMSIKLESAKQWAESAENPLNINFKNGDKITKYEPLNSKFEVVNDNSGVYYRIYLNNSNIPYTTIERQAQKWGGIGEK